MHPDCLSVDGRTVVQFPLGVAVHKGFPDCVQGAAAMQLDDRDILMNFLGNVGEPVGHEATLAFGVDQLQNLSFDCSLYVASCLSFRMLAYLSASSPDLAADNTQACSS